MDLFDKLALMGRRYEQRRSPRSGKQRLDLIEVLEMYRGKAILELTSSVPGKEALVAKSDSDRKHNLSLLDGLSEVHLDAGGYYEVFETAPSGDLSRVKIAAHSASGAATGELRLLVGRRSPDYYYQEDPLLNAIKEYRSE